MKRLLIVIGLVLVSAVVWHWPVYAQSTNQGIPATFNVTNSAGGTAIFAANTNRRFLMCENVGLVNAIFITWGQTATATNGFLLTSNGGAISLPQGGCNSAGAGVPPANGCVPTSAINAIAAASGTNTLVCVQD